MRSYEIEITNRYLVNAESEEQALASYRIAFDDGDAEILGITPEELIAADNFEFLGGSGRAVWAGGEI
jgi:hypothetical protein